MRNHRIVLAALALLGVAVVPAGPAGAGAPSGTNGSIQYVERDGNRYLWEVKPDGTGNKVIATTTWAGYQVRWDKVELAPDGHLLMGSGQQLVSTGWRDFMGQFSRSFGYVGLWGWFGTQATWAPDSRRVAYIETGPQGAGWGELWMWDPTGAMRRLAPGWWARHPAWAPVGNWIAFEITNGSSLAQIAVVHPDGTGLRFLTTTDLGLPWNANGKTWPSFSPDGQHVAFAMDGDLWRVSVYASMPNVPPPGKALRQLTKGAAIDETPAYSPDGTKIAFVRNGALMKVNADVCVAAVSSVATCPRAGNVVRIATPGVAGVEAPFWSKR